MIRHGMQSVLIILVVSMLFACGGDKNDPRSADDQAAVQAQFAQALSPGVQCSEVATVATGPNHTVGLKSDGTVTAVGYNVFGMLKVSPWKGIKAVAVGDYHTVGLKSDGTVTAIGDNTQGQLNVSSWTKIKAIAAGPYHTIGVKEDGTVVVVGLISAEQSKISTWTDIKAIATADKHTVGLKSDGTVTAVGDSSYGKLKVDSWSKIIAIAAMNLHTIGLKSDGTVTAVGYNYGQLNVSSWTKIKAIATGMMHTVGVKEDGTVVAVGYPNNANQLNVSSWTGIKAVVAGPYHTIGIKDDGTIVGVGDSTNDKLNFSSWNTIMPVCETNKDVTPPVTKAVVVSGTSGNNGWYVSDVQMTLTATDNDGGSGVKEIHYSVDGAAEIIVPGNSALVVITGDGTHAVNYYAIDNAGNVEASPQLMGINTAGTPPQVANINIDKTPPTITATVSPSPNANGWYNTDVTVKFNCSDSGSGIASCPADIPVTTEGAGQTIVETAFDKAGNSAKAEVKLNIDKTPPSISSLLASPQVLWPPNRSLVNVVLSGSIAENGSGIASTVITVTDEYGLYNTTVLGFGSTVQLESWRRGTDNDGRLYTITAVTTDNAGNKSSPMSTKVIVPHDMGGGSNQGQDDDDHNHGKDHHEHGHHDQHHKKGHDHDGHGDGRQHDNDRGSRH